jgi:hypothetical protein
MAQDEPHEGMVAPGFDLALAMLAGIAIGTLVQSVLGVLSTLLGMFHVMIPDSLIGCTVASPRA